MEEAYFGQLTHQNLVHFLLLGTDMGGAGIPDCHEITEGYW